MIKRQLTVTKQLDLFLTRARQLEQTRLIRSKPNSSWKMHFSEDGTMTITTEEPDEEDLRSYLMILRQFVLQKEPIHLGRIHNLLDRRITDDELRGYVTKARDGLKEAARGHGIHFQLNDETISPERVADLWINGEYFHNDPEKKQELDRLLPHPVLMMKHQFVTFVLDLQRVISYTGMIVNHARKHGLIDES